MENEKPDKEATDAQEFLGMWDAANNEVFNATAIEKLAKLGASFNHENKNPSPPNPPQLVIDSLSQYNAAVHQAVVGVAGVPPWPSGGPGKSASLSQGFIEETVKAPSYEDLGYNDPIYHEPDHPDDEPQQPEEDDEPIVVLELSLEDQKQLVANKTSQNHKQMNSMFVQPLFEGVAKLPEPPPLNLTGPTHMVPDITLGAKPLLTIKRVMTEMEHTLDVPLKDGVVLRLGFNSPLMPSSVSMWIKSLLKGYMHKPLDVIQKQVEAYVTGMDFAYEFLTEEQLTGKQEDAEMVKRAPMNLYKGMSYPHTQKARGLAFLKNRKSYMWPYWHVPSNVMVIPWNVSPDNGKPLKFPLFARPCPITPRHGFVESRLVRSWTDLFNLYRVAMEEDGKKAEIILMPPFTARVSAVATNKGVTWGKGNDGATGGKEGCLLVPTPGERAIWNNTLAPPGYLPAYIQMAGGLVKDTAFIELVEHEGNVTAVQLRDGPQIPGTVNYFPTNATRVKKVITIKDIADPTDLLAWEKYVTKVAAKFPKGVVFHNPKGTLASHAAVHAVLSKFTVICDDREVKEGDVLKKDNEVHALTAKDFETIAKSMKDASDCVWFHHITHPGENQQTLQVPSLVTALGAIHAQGVWGREAHLLRLRAWAPVALARFIVSACVGESRHWYRNGPGRWAAAAKPANAEQVGECGDIPRLYSPAIPWEQMREGTAYKSAYDMHTSVGRDAVWKKTFGWPWANMEDLATRAMHDLGHKGWGSSALSTEKSGYGGSPWANAARQARALIICIDAFMAKPSEKRWIRMMKQANITLNTVHNGGRVLTKWLSTSVLDNIALNPALGFGNRTAAMIVMGASLPVPKPLNGQE